eukprot:2744034-Prymnesium_polylepis.1
MRRTLTREEPNTPWRAAQWVPVAGPMGTSQPKWVHRSHRGSSRATLQTFGALYLRCGDRTGAVMTAQADAGAWQKAVAEAVEGRDQRCFGFACGFASVTHRSITVHVRCGGCAWRRACVCRHQPLSDAAAWARKRLKSAISTA